MGLLDENAEFEDNTLAAIQNKFKIPLSSLSITALGCLVKNIEKVKKPKRKKFGAKKKADEILTNVDVATYV